MLDGCRGSMKHRCCARVTPSALFSLLILSFFFFFFFFLQELSSLFFFFFFFVQISIRFDSVVYAFFCPSARLSGKKKKHLNEKKKKKKKKERSSQAYIIILLSLGTVATNLMYKSDALPIGDFVSLTGEAVFFWWIFPPLYLIHIIHDTLATF